MLLVALYMIYGHFPSDVANLFMIISFSHRFHAYINRRMILIYDRLAPMNDFALQTPSLVRILWTDFVSGSTHAASRLSSVMNPWLLAHGRPTGHASLRVGWSRRPSSWGSTESRA